MMLKSLVNIKMPFRLPPSSNRPDVRLLNNRIWPLPSEVGGGNRKEPQKQYFKPTNLIVMIDGDKNRTRIIGLRLTFKEYQQIEKKYKASTSKKLSEYVRQVLFNKPITVLQRNQSLDDFMAEMIQLRAELNAVGNNFNQAVKKLHILQQIPEFKAWLITYELEKQTLINKVDQIKNRINKIADQWLQ